MSTQQQPIVVSHLVLPSLISVGIVQWPENNPRNKYVPVPLVQLSDGPILACVIPDNYFGIFVGLRAEAQDAVGPVVLIGGRNVCLNADDSPGPTDPNKCTAAHMFEVVPDEKGSYVANIADGETCWFSDPPMLRRFVATSEYRADTSGIQAPLIQVYARTPAHPTIYAKQMRSMGFHDSARSAPGAGTQQINIMVESSVTPIEGSVATDIEYVPNAVAVPPIVLMSIFEMLNLYPHLASTLARVFVRPQEGKWWYSGRPNNLWLNISR